MNPLTLIGDSFILVGRQWRLIFRANWWVLPVLLGALVGSSWFSLRLLWIVPTWMGVELVQTAGTAIALSPEFFTLVATGFIVRRTSERLGGFAVGIGSGGQGRFLRRWILISGLIFLGLFGIEVAYNRYLEIMAQRGAYEFQGIVFMIRYYTSAVIFFIGLYFLVALQSRATAMAGVDGPRRGAGWRTNLVVMVAGLILYISVTPAISEIFLYLPPMGFFWATLDRLQPPYFFLTETARIGAQVVAPIIYAGFIIVSGQAARRSRA